MSVEQYVFKVPAAIKSADFISKTLEKIKNGLKVFQKEIRAQADKHQSKALQYQVRDKVWLVTDNLYLMCQFKKLTK